MAESRSHRDKFEDELIRKMKGIFREFEEYLKEKYGFRTVDQQIAEKARQLTERFNTDPAAPAPAPETERAPVGR